MKERIDAGSDARDRSMEDVVQRVYRAAIEDCDGGTCAIGPILESCVRQTVASLWSGTNLKTFVPLLAMRNVKECIRSGTCDAPAESGGFS